MTAPLPRDPIALAQSNWRDQGWAPAAEGMGAVTAIMRVQQLLLARIEEALKPFEISFARFELLRLLGFTHDQRMALSRARELLQVHPASITNVAKRLEADGLVRRTAHPKDGRSVILELTGPGAQVAARATQALNTQVFEDLGFSDEELGDLRRILAGYRRRSGDFIDESPLAGGVRQVSGGGTPADASD